MNIVINTTSLSNNKDSGNSDFINDCLLKIIQNQPEHSFFIITGVAGAKFFFGRNTTIIAAPKFKNILFVKYWYAYRLPFILKKYSATLFVNYEGICSLRSKVPQCIMVQQLQNFEPGKFIKIDKIAFLQKAELIITFGQTIKNIVCTKYNIETNKVAVINTSASELYLPANEAAKETTKEKYTEGKAYFLFSGQISDAGNLINLLKAYSFFKKRLQSNMQLVITTNFILPGDTFIKSLQSYKYKDEVNLLVGLLQSEVIKITAAAYAFVYVTKQDSIYRPLLQAMQCEVPVITNNTILMNEICADAALFTTPEDFKNIADKMMHLFKDEASRNVLIENGKQRAAQFTLDVASNMLWLNMVKCAGTTP